MCGVGGGRSKHTHKSTLRVLHLTFFWESTYVAVTTSAGRKEAEKFFQGERIFFAPKNWGAVLVCSASFLFRSTPREKKEKWYCYSTVQSNSDNRDRSGDAPPPCASISHLTEWLYDV